MVLRSGEPHGLPVATVAKRTTMPTDRVDPLSKLSVGKDEEEQPMGCEELSVEALTQCNAGYDITSKYASPFFRVFPTNF